MSAKMTIHQNDISREIANFADFLEANKDKVPIIHQSKIVGLVFEMRDTAKVICCCDKCRPLQPGYVCECD
jgi:hypothetical protein